MSPCPEPDAVPAAHPGADNPHFFAWELQVEDFALVYEPQFLDLDDAIIDGPNPFCSNRSSAGDACGSCPGCEAAVERLRAQLERERREW
jgi:hypothetical protein